VTSSPFGWFADLHTHTTASDGLATPSDLIAKAVAAGLRAIAICDHDTVAGSLEATALAYRELQIIPGIEMSANVGEDEVHVLGYFLDRQSRDLTRALTELRHQRIERMRRFCVRLTELRLPLSFEEVQAESSGETIGRPHVARAMIKHGYVSSVNDAFERYLASGRPAFIPRTDITPEWSIELIHRAGGVASLAHPFTIAEPYPMIEHLVRHGLDAIEVEYGEYISPQRAWLRQVAAEFDLLSTGGSDFHGEGHREDAPLGSGGVTLEQLGAIKQRSTQYKSNQP
jgi:predicted metal-dependent phosphoesterase TrpH